MFVSPTVVTGNIIADFSIFERDKTIAFSTKSKINWMTIFVFRIFDFFS